MRVISPPSRRRAVVAVKAAILMPVLLAVVALAVDAGILYDRERHAQATAEAAALAAAGDLFRTYSNTVPTDDGKDLGGTARDHALAVAKENGYPNDGATADVVVNIPPQSGPYAGQDGYVEVLLTYHQPRGFSGIFGGGKLAVGARAVARGRWAARGLGILVLDPTGARALTVSGGAAGLVPSATVVVNSTHPQAAYGEGTTAALSAKQFDVTGNYQMSGGGTQFVGPIRTEVPPTPDPYRHLAQPDPNSLPLRSKETATVVDLGGGSKTYYLEPGLYEGGLLFEGKSSVVMAPGVYYMRGDRLAGGFKFRGTDVTSLTATGVMLFNDKGTNTETDPTSGAYPQINISGNARVTWTPPATGVYRGLSFFQARDQSMTVSIAGNGTMSIAGAYYARDALIDIAGNGVNYVGSQFVSHRLTMRGTGTYHVPWDAGTIMPVRDFRIVE